MAESVLTFTTDQSDPSGYPLNSKVGRIYEVGINGVGYMLSDMEAEHQDLKYLRKVVPLDPQRFATGDTPFSESLERYVFTAMSDWTGGTGQKFLDRPASSPEGFFDSDSVNPFEPGKLSLLKQTQNTISSTANPCRAAVASDLLFVQDGPKALKSQTAPNAAATSFNVAAATTITDMDSDGINYYVAAGTAGIFKGATAADPGAAWSAVQASIVRWAANRICVAYIGAGSSTPNVFSTLNASGLEEVNGGRMILPIGWTITDITSGLGFVWFSAFAGDHSTVFLWQIGSDAPSVALENETGEICRSIFYYQGQVMMRTSTFTATGQSIGRIWRCPVTSAGISSNGTLTPFLLATLNVPTTTDDGPGTFGALGQYVFFSWVDMDTAAGTTDGIGCIDLATGGYCKWLKGAVGTGQVRAITSWRGRVVFTLDGLGAYIEHATAYCSTGTLDTSFSDKASVLDKIIDTITLQALQLQDTCSVDVSWSLDEGASYTLLSGGSLTGTGARRVVTTFGKKGSSVGVRLTLHAGTSNLTTPVMTLLSIRMHPHGLADIEVQLPINCSDEIVALTNARIPADSGPGKGAKRARSLEQLMATRVRYQDIDWASTKQDEIFEVIGVDLQSQLTRGGSSTSARMAQIAIVTMRKVLK